MKDHNRLLVAQDEHSPKMASAHLSDAAFMNIFIDENISEMCSHS